MTVTLDRIDIINMLKGTTPSRELLHHIEYDLRLGYYNGSQDLWKWHYSLEQFKTYSDEELYNLYLKVK